MAHAHGHTTDSTRRPNVQRDDGLASRARRPDPAERVIAVGADAPQLGPLRQGTIAQLQRRLGNQASLRLLAASQSARDPMRPAGGPSITLQRVIDPAELQRLGPNPAQAAAQTFRTAVLTPELNLAFPKTEERRPKANEYLALAQTKYARVKELADAATYDGAAFRKVVDEMVALLAEYDRFKAQQVQVKFGTEFSFTSDQLVRLEVAKDNTDAYNEAKRLLGEWSKRVRASRVPGVQLTTSTEPAKGQKSAQAVKFTYTSDANQATWWWRLDLDDGCLETQSDPMTAAQATAGNGVPINEIIQAQIFDVGRALGLRADPLVGGGHLSLDRATTLDSALTLRNFLVIYANEANAWAREDADAYNAPTIADLNNKGKQAFKSVIGTFDAAYPQADKQWTIEKLCDNLRAGVFKAAHYGSEENAADPGGKKRAGSPLHYQATNIEHLADKDVSKRRLEMRRFDAQQSLADLLNDMDKLAALTARARVPVLIPLKI